MAMRSSGRWTPSRKRCVAGTALAADGAAGLEVGVSGVAV
jgi:hypothetical protein